MKIVTLIIVLLFNLLAGDIELQDCYVTSKNYIECGNKPTKRVLPLNFCKGANFLFRKDDQIPEKSLAVVVRSAIDAQGPYTDEYFILDYKNMMVYDNKCLEGNFAFIKDNIVYFYKWEQSGKFIFKKEDFNHCKQPLKEWLKKPYNPY